MSKTNNMDDFEFIDYDNNTNTQKKKHSKKKKKRGFFQKLIITIEALVALLFALVIVLYATPNMTSKILNSTWGQKFLKSSMGQSFMAGMVDKEGYDNVFDSNFVKEDIKTNEELDLSILDDYMNIALFGLDNGTAKDRVEGGDSCDCIMILSIHKETSDVKILSIYRDTYLKIINNDGSFRNFYKVNSSYGGSKGGAGAIVNTLNKNLDLNIQDYVMVNFNGIAKIIDLLGGIEVNITEDEMNYINGYLTETREITGIDSPDVTTFGENIHLNGLQATAYSRIRYTAFYNEDGTSVNNDYGRAARQRSVITKMVGKAKDAGVQNVMKMCDEIFKSEEKIFKTSIPYEDVIKLIPIVLNFSFGETGAFPFTLTTNTELGVYLPSGDTVIASGLDYNVIQLHKFFFPEERYTPSSTVSDISEDIYNETGAKTVKLEDYAGIDSV